MFERLDIFFTRKPGTWAAVEPLPLLQRYIEEEYAAELRELPFLETTKQPAEYDGRLQFYAQSGWLIVRYSQLDFLVDIGGTTYPRHALQLTYDPEGLTEQEVQARINEAEAKHAQTIARIKSMVKRDER